MDLLDPSIDNIKLSPELQKIGRNRFMRFVRINTISYCCLSDTILILYAIKIGADDFFISLMASFLYLTMPLMFIGKRMIGKFGAAHTFGTSWVIRNFFAAFMVLVPVTISISNQSFGLNFLLFSAFLFFAFRSIGFTAYTPLIGDITDKTNRGHFLSRIWLHFNMFYFITLLVLMLIFGYSDSTQTFQVIILGGCVFGIVASMLVYHIPESTGPRISGRIPVSQSFSFLWRNIQRRKLLFSWTAATTASMLIIPFSMVALKNGYSVSDHKALFFALIQLLGGIIASSFNIFMLGRVGPRPMLILYSFGLVANAFLWILSPQQFIPFYQAAIFFINGMALAGINTSLSHYFLTVVPETERVGTNMFYLIISGAVAGIVGTILGGGLLTLLRIFDLSGFSIYRTFFVIILFVLLPLFYIIKKVEPIEDWRVKEVLKIFVSFHDLRALFALNKLENKS
jgi:hypothetical protein